MNGKANSGESVNHSEGLNINKRTVIGIIALLVVITAAVGIMTQTVPRGEYELDSSGAIIDGTYAVNEQYKMPVWKIIASPVLAFTSSNAVTGIMILAIITLIGGTFLILDRIGVLKYIMVSIVERFKDRRYALIAVMVFAGMFLSSVAGVLEESLTLVPVAVAVSLAMGWDSLLGISMSLVSVAFGFTAATFNPFNVITVQKLASLDIFSGLWLRIVIFALVYAALTLFLISYAKKIEKDPTRSLAYESDKLIRDRYSMEKCSVVMRDEGIRAASKTFLRFLLAVLGGVCLSFILSVAGNALGNDALAEIGGYASLGAMAVFFPVGGLCAGYRSFLRGKALLKAFLQGVKTVLPIYPVIIFILAVTYILDEGMIMHTLLYKINSLTDGISPYAAVLLIFLFIAVLEFFIGSGTAKAFLVVPFLSMLCDMTGVTRQTMVVTFCMADGFTNLIYPTSGLMIIAIGMVGVSYKNWLRFSWRLFVCEGIIAAAVMLFAVAVGYK